VIGDEAITSDHLTSDHLGSEVMRNVHFRNFNDYLKFDQNSHKKNPF